jgi:hypothetical protein
MMSDYVRIATENIKAGDYVSPPSRKFMWSRARRYRPARGYAPIGSANNDAQRGEAVHISKRLVLTLAQNEVLILGDEYYD